MWIRGGGCKTLSHKMWIICCVFFKPIPYKKNFESKKNQSQIFKYGLYRQARHAKKVAIENSLMLHTRENPVPSEEAV